MPMVGQFPRLLPVLSIRATVGSAHRRLRRRGQRSGHGRLLLFLHLLPLSLEHPPCEVKLSIHTTYTEWVSKIGQQDLRVDAGCSSRIDLYSCVGKLPT